MRRLILYYCNIILYYLFIIRGNNDSAAAFLASARDKAPFLYEPFFNGALLARRMGDIEEASKLLRKAKELSGESTEITEMQTSIEKELMCI